MTEGRSFLRHMVHKICCGVCYESALCYAIYAIYAIDAIIIDTLSAYTEKQ
ncbi:hypothetical protein RhiirB3_411947 [Rhizophagus irregularis]|nr:hypothetical protein RhiirB3_411947 [Rhizophagus irregularis]